MFQLYFKKANIDGTYWTMIVEMLFYINILFLFRFNLLKYLNLIGLSTSVFVLLITQFFYIPPVRIFFIYFPLLQFIPLFFSGILFYKLFTNQKNALTSYVLIAFCLISQIILFNFTGVSRYFISIWAYSSMLILYFILFYLFINRKLSFIVSRITLFFGKISFALYLIHEYNSMEIIIPYLTHQLHFNFWIASLFISLPLMILLSAFITFYIEKPLSKKLKEKLRSLINSKTESIIIQ